MYRFMGFSKPIADSPSKGRAKATVHMQLKEFTLAVRGVVSRGSYDDQPKQALKLLHISKDKFLDIALKGKYQAPSLKLAMSEEMCVQVRKCLITLGHEISATQVERFLRGELALTPSSPNLKGRVGWDSKLGVSPGLCEAMQLVEQKQQSNLQKQAKYPFCMTCPECNGNELSSNMAFQLHDLDRTCKCKQCKQSSKIRDWRCGCGLRWHLCDLHAVPGQQKQARNSPTDKPCRGTKRTLGPFTHEKLVEIDAKRARRRPATILPPDKLNLSVRLRERFPHLLS